MLERLRIQIKLKANKIKKLYKKYKHKALNI